MACRGSGVRISLVPLILRPYPNQGFLYTLINIQFFLRKLIMKNFDNVSNLKTQIRFVNHASVLIGSENKTILCDPWYEQSAFNKGWNLLFENSNKEILDIISQTKFIWISHEHPDHFSVNFFEKFRDYLIKYKIIILFQKTLDNKVINFLKKYGFNVLELKFNKWISLTKGLDVFCIKDRRYDSALLIKINGEKLLNLNDCIVNKLKRAKEIFGETGKVDILLTQFSYAAWKGGKQNIKWREKAAIEKLEAIKLQLNIFQPRYLVPFASFIYFSNVENFYLNDSRNSIKKVYQYLSKSFNNCIIMKPGDVLGGPLQDINTNRAIDFWNDLDDSISEKELNYFEKVDYITLKKLFLNFNRRINEKNNMFLIKIIRKISPIKFFNPVRIYLTDLDLVIEFDYINTYIKNTNKTSHISMHSESLAFIFKNSYGFQTLTINACFEETCRNGLEVVTRTLAIDAFNNSGIYFSLKTLLNLKLIFSSLFYLNNIKKHLIYNQQSSD